MNEPTWADTVGLLRGLGEPTRATVELLEQAEHTWNGKVVPRHSMGGLMFTLPGVAGGAAAQLVLSWAVGTFEFRLFDARRLIAADRCDGAHAPIVLDTFLAQLVDSAAGSVEG